MVQVKAVLEKKLLPIPFTLRFELHPPTDFHIFILSHELFSLFWVATNFVHFQPVRHPQPPQAELTAGGRPYSRLVKAPTRWWKMSGCPFETTLGVANVLWIFRHPVYSPDLPCQDGYQCFHHSHFLEHCDSPGDQSFGLPHHRQTTNDHLLDHHCTRASHLSDESILATLTTSDKLSWTLAFLQKMLRKQISRQSGLFFRIVKNLRKLPKALFAEGCQFGQFSCVRPPPHPSQCQMIIIGDKFYLSIISDILWGKGVDICCAFSPLARRWWKSSLETYQMVVW